MEQTGTIYDAHKQTGILHDAQVGLTKREYFAVMALQGLFGSELRHRIGHKDLIAMSVMAADRLIEELNKTK